MFERFTERAQRVLFFSRYEASQLGSTDIDTEHLLLGLIRECKGLTNRLFTEAGIALDEIRDEVLRRVGVRTKISTSAEIPFSTAAKRVLLHTEQEADRLLHDYIGTEHLLLGLLREQGCVAADVLTSRGLRLDSVRGQIVQFLSDGERPERPGPPGIPANTFKWPWLRFVPSRTVHILHSELKPPQRPVTNCSGPGLQAYGYTLTEAIVHAWRGNRWHIDMVDGLDDGTRYDFYIQFARTEPVEIFLQMWRDAVEQQFELSVTRETQRRDVWVARSIGHGGPMLRSYGEAEQGTGFAMATFNLVIDETGLRGLYGFELTRTVANADELIDLLRDQAGLSITREQHDTPALVVRRR